MSEGIEIRHGCQFLSSSVRALAKLPGGLGRFLPCRVGSHLSRLRHPGWIINVLKVCPVRLFWNPVILRGSRLYASFWMALLQGSAAELLHGTHFHRMRLPPWSLPRVGDGRW